MVKDSGGLVKSKAKGTVNFPPFENLDEASLREVKRYQICPFGKIQEYCRHIPYNSGKKDFYEKTGRESFEVFQYIFKAPGDDSEYTVMWDYNVGLVRMTPFFKCCKYSKTMPAKMLNMNPGLRDITHSITGGSIMAQGYWMPFTCAKAVCATFCAPIAGALIPIFGPGFPSQCVAPGAPEHGRMAIDPSVVVESAREAAMFRRMYVNANAVASNSHLPHHHHQHQHQQHQQIHHYIHGPALPSPTSIPSPRLARRALHRPGSPYDYDKERVDFGGRVRFKGGSLDGPYPGAVGSDQEMHSGPDTPPLHHHALHRGIPYSPMSPSRSSGWTVANHASSSTSSTSCRPHSSSNYPGPANYQHPGGFREGDLRYSGGPNPLLSAIPRFGHQARLDHYQTTAPYHHRLPPIPQAPAAAWNAPKRPAPEVDADCEYDGQSESSPTTTVVTTTTAASRVSGGWHQEDDDGPPLPHSAVAGAGAACSSTAATSGAEKNAALLLMNLSVRDTREAWGQEDKHNMLRRGEGHGRLARGGGMESVSMSPVSAAAVEGHRSKRRRATSM